MPVDNPSSNQLPKSMKVEDVLNAVQSSGYPLQCHVADQLRRGFELHEEWCYVDSDSGQLRTLDILGEAALREPDRDHRIRPHLALLIECKQSDLPYVFFRTTATEYPRDFPFLAGMHDYSIDVHPTDTSYTYDLDFRAALGLSILPFSAKPPEICTTLSKVTKKGQQLEELELSGTKAYMNLVLPLLKAMEHYQELEKPPESASFFDLVSVCGVGVLDAPMIVFTIDKGEPKLLFQPWVRVYRHGFKFGEAYQRRRLFAIDIVHKDFFSTYLQDHVLPFADEFARRSIYMHEILAERKAYARSVDDIHVYGRL